MGSQVNADAARMAVRLDGRGSSTCSMSGMLLAGIFIPGDDKLREYQRSSQKDEETSMKFIELLMAYGGQALVWYAMYVLVGSCAFGAYVWRRTGVGH
ncbi:hypothetical protein EJD96_11365 [Herbaspirillum seropedicae]|uniref:hypothetical protein n=1 Tax=Herbaspirillum seropedicae TaxID=964 RepID=UPI001121E0E0|nr:hypothetical protein [Herbaspirillum seropedicae]QDD64723.1 hypothetical protein EJD96_11365 [Herbaspirillum seropedicae]